MSSNLVSANNNQNDLTKKRVVYKIPNMDEVEVQNVKYKTVDHTALTMDIYYPPSLKRGSRLPVVIFVIGYADSTAIRMIGSKIKDIGQYISWGQLSAASELIAITYETQQPDADINELISNIRRNAASLMIDENKIGVWSCSGNVPTALSVIMQEPRDYLKCAVLYYGFMLDRDESHKVAEMAEKVGFIYPLGTKTFEDLPQDVPLFIVRTGLDKTPHLNETIDHFVGEAVARNVQMVFINYANGHHAFDILDDNDKSREIIRQTLEFMRIHLLSQK